MLRYRALPIIAMSLLLILSAAMLSRTNYEWLKWPSGPTPSFSIGNGIKRADELEYSKRARILSSFIFGKLMSREGAIHSTYYTGYPGSENFGVNHEVLSESAGLALLYAYYSRNLSLFRLLMDFVEERFISPHGTLYWKLNSNLTPFGRGGHYSSALIDDLRVLKALILGYRAWNETKALDLSLRISKGIRNYERGGNLVESISWRSNELYKSDKVTLAYLDLRALELLAEIDGRWRGLFESAKDCVMEGRRDGLFFHTLLNVKTGKYEDLFDVCDSLRQLLIMDYLVDIGLKEEVLPLFKFFKERFEGSGEIYGLYDSNGNGSIGGIGIGTYAILASLALKLRDEELAKKIVDSKLLVSQDLDERSPLYGAMIARWPGDRLDANSFDNLMGAITLALTLERDG